MRDSAARAARPQHAMAGGLLLALGLLAGCGYTLSGTSVRIPGEIHSVSVGQFENRSREEGLAKALSFALEREFYERGTLPLRENPNEGEGVLSGTIKEFKAWPVSYDKQDDALQYEVEMTVDVSLKRQSDGTVLWKASQIHAYEEFSVSRNTVVPSSSQFQRGTLDFNNLQNLSDIQLAETEKRLAIDRLLHSIVRDVHDRILDDF